MGWPRIKNEDADKIDAFLGEGTYEKLSELDTAGRDQLVRASKLSKQLWHYDPSLAVLAPYGTDWVEKAHNDLAWGLDLIIAGKFPDPAQFRQLYDIYPLAMDAADLQMDEAEAIPYAGLIKGVASLRSVGLTIAVRQLHDELLELDEMLREAQDEEVEGEIKAALGLSITSVELMLPGLSVLAQAGLTAGEIIMDRDNPGKVVQKGANFGLESVERIEKVSHSVKRYAKRGGKLVTVIGFYFDADEVLGAKKNTKRIKALLEKTKKEYEELLDKWGGAIRSLVAFQDHIDSFLKPVRVQMWNKWRERNAMIQKYNYSLTQPIKWTIVDDYARFKTAHR
jgi:hypothetical protein